jgi:UDP-N-acetylmuramate dehydrogenase
LNIQYNISLKPLHTFGTDVSATSYAVFNSVDELVQLLSEKKVDLNNLLVLGGGSNVLFCQDFDGLVLKNEIEGISLVMETEEHFYVKAGAGVNWHQFVLYCVHHGYGGVENLALIPGSVGASPIQNIGAYGVELKDVFYELEALKIDDLKTVVMKKADCVFGYRDSIFKRAFKGKYIITSVTFLLHKKPVYNTTYGAINEELRSMGVDHPNGNSIAQAVMNIRNSKLPDPSRLGNAGSFFKNPSIDTEDYNRLKESFPSIAGYPAENNKIKIAAGWLIEQCGWKGFRKGDAGCYEKQALVLVNYGNAKGSEILQLSNDIVHSVYEKFGIMLEREVNVI